MTKKKTLILLALVLLLPVGQSAGMASRHKLRQIKKELKSRDRPIVFYGVVADDNGTPVSDAEIEIHYRHYSPKLTAGTGKKHVARIRQESSLSRG